ncbi:hypothetical protein M408DRAFT_186215 [Serendipita vermifera MAFF 305830]|uniref:Uncharacterized protein n=1 Tax=Serendipita vermifera MAFF 305830 TaxID=933852 RepID=A0A0C2XV43_SERVB|nr:hypothetical protein M408DRAFT_186215 [Serendipita vermifera MAFF 305830]
MMAIDNDYKVRNASKNTRVGRSASTPLAKLSARVQALEKRGFHIKLGHPTLIIEPRDLRGNYYYMITVRISAASLRFGTGLSRRFFSQDTEREAAESEHRRPFQVDSPRVTKQSELHSRLSKL